MGNLLSVVGNSLADGKGASRTGKWGQACIRFAVARVSNTQREYFWFAAGKSGIDPIEKQAARRG
jgi:hypothetical protein